MTRWMVGLALTAFAGLSMGADSCDTETTSKPDAGGDAKKESSPTAHLGDSITLKGTDVRMKVKVSKVLDPLPVGEFDTPEKGTRFVGVQVALRNVSDKTYDDSPTNGATIITAKDDEADSTIVSGGPCAGGFATSAKISPGARRRGCLPFQVPKRQKLKTFQFALDSGFGPSTGEWSLR